AATFNSGVTFEEARFGEDVHFRNVDFGDFCTFTAATFQMVVAFDACVVRGEFDLYRVVSYGAYGQRWPSGWTARYRACCGLAFERNEQSGEPSVDKRPWLCKDCASIGRCRLGGDG